MPKLNFLVFATACLLFFLCSGTTMRDRILIHSIHLVEHNALVEPSAKVLFEGALSGAIRQLLSLHDDYSGYIPYVDQEEFEGNLDNRYDGIGITYSPSRTKEEPPEIIYPLRHSPAFEAGLRSGDRILKVNGQSTLSLSLREVSELFKGETGKNVDLTLLPFGKSETIEVSVSREPLHRDSVEGDGIDGEGKRIFRLQTRSEFGYVRITSFSDQTAVELRNALQGLDKQGVAGLILDLRDCPGGYVSTAVQIANFFVKPTPNQDVIVSTRHRNGKTKSIHKAQNPGYFFNKPMVVLIDEETASAAEILSACLQDYGRATIVGCRSFGKGVVQEIFVLPLNSGTISLSDASYWRPSQKNINRGWNSEDSDEWGVSPDPEGEISVSRRQRYAQIQIRDRRANLVCDDKEQYWIDYLKRLPNDVEHQFRFSKEGLEMDHEEDQSEDDGEEDAIENPFVEIPEEGSDIEKKRELSGATRDKPRDDREIQGEDQEKNEAPFVLRGAAPYFDPQLDRAIERLEKKIR